MKITIISTTKLRYYKRFDSIIDAIILVCLIAFLFNIQSIGGKWNSYLVLILIYLQFHLFFTLFLIFENGSYDDSAIIDNKNGYEGQMLLGNILSIEVKTVNGIYSIKL